MIKDIQLTELNLLELKPYANNPRKNDKAAEELVKAIKQVGYVNPIIVDENYEILAGHTRYKALKKLGWTSAPVLIKNDLSEEQKKKYRLLDNKLGELADWDLDLLAKEIDELDFDDLDIDWGIDFENEEIQEPDVPEAPEEPKSKLGEIYQLGRHRLMCGDSTDATQVLRLVGGVDKVDLLITDPPYNVDYTGKTKDALKIENDHLEDSDFRQFLVNAFSSADGVMKCGAVFYIWHADGEGYNFHGACRDVGWKVRQCIIWNKNSMVMGRQDYQWKHEPCLYGWKEGASHLWASDRKQTTILEFDKPNANKEHPTMKPVALFDYQIKNNTKGGDLVLDLFGGSGTTIMACEQNGRNACVMEYDPKYVDVIIKRWEDFTGDKAVKITE